MKRGTPNSSVAAAMPTNSETVTPPLAISSASMTNAVQRTPKRSRIRSASPLPVTAPMRAHISWTIPRLIVMGMRIQRRR